MLSQSQLLETAITAARRAGTVQKEKFGKLLNVDAKLADDIKLEADRLCEQTIIETIRAAFPTHAILAEESGKAEGADYIWYVDPLDGTVNFYYGLPYFCTTLACYRQPSSGAIGPDNMGEPLVGVTYAPPTDELIVGAPGLGVTLNGAPVRIREESSLAESCVVTAFGSSGDKLRFTSEVLLPLATRVRKLRNLGALAYDLANVASGRASAVVQAGFNVWDVATGRVLVEAAGGEFHARRYACGIWAVAASGKTIHPALLAALDSFA